METIEHNGRTYQVEIEPDYGHGAPWEEEEDGHGPVSEWTSRAKLPGEVIISQDRGSYRYYDFAEACRIAKRDGWGFLPGKLIVDRFAHHGARKFRAYVLNRRDLTAYGKDRNAAVSALYALHKAIMTARQYAAGAARADMERMRAWCNDEWHYVGVIVTAQCQCCEDFTGPSASLWGIESDAFDYLDEVARELADELDNERVAA